MNHIDMGDPAGALAQVAETQAAIDSIRGKTVTIDVTCRPDEDWAQYRARIRRLFRHYPGLKAKLDPGAQRWLDEHEPEQD